MYTDDRRDESLTFDADLEVTIQDLVSEYVDSTADIEGWYDDVFSTLLEDEVEDEVEEQEVVEEGHQEVAEVVAEQELATEFPIEEDNGQPIRRAKKRVVNDYTLAWDIYSLGYSTGDIAKIYGTSAGSISRGIQKDGHVTRTSAETRAMVSQELPTDIIHRIIDLLNEKFDTEEERNSRFASAFGVNLYELSLYEEEDGDLQAIELQLNGELVEEYEERPLSSFTEKYKLVHKTLEDAVVKYLGKTNLETGAVKVITSVTYENGVSVRVTDSNRIKAKALVEDTVTVMVDMTDYILQGFAREVEAIYNRFDGVLGRTFVSAKLTQLGNRMVVGLENE